MDTHSDILDETMSGEDCSISSRMSNKSEKNMADFDGEDCDDELMQLAAHAQVVISVRYKYVNSFSEFNCRQFLQANMTPQQLSHIAYHARLPVNKNLLAASLQDYTPMIPHFNLENVCKPGSTLLWDLVQDDKIVRQ